MADEKLPYPLENMRTITTDSGTWLAERERRGATRVDTVRWTPLVGQD